MAGTYPYSNNGWNDDDRNAFRQRDDDATSSIQRRRTRLLYNAMRDAEDEDNRSLSSGRPGSYGNDGTPLTGSVKKEKTFLDKAAAISPIIGAFRTYTLRDMLKDFLAGMTISLVLIPQGIGFAILADINVYHGILSGIFPVFIYAFLGGGKHLSVGPEAATTVVLAETIRFVREEHPELKNADTYQIAALITILVGLIDVIFAVLRLGFLNNMLSGSLLIGFVGALGTLIIAEQLAPLTGIIKPEAELSTMEKFRHFFMHLRDIHPGTIIVGLVGIAFLLGMQVLKGKVKHPIVQNMPSVLILVAVMISASAGVGFQGKGISTLGEITLKFQPPRLPDVPFSIIPTLIQPAITMSVVGFIETMVAANAFANKHDYQVSGNRELAALGACNVFGGMLGSYTVIASFARSKIYEAAGARTMIGGLFSGGFVLAIYVLLLPVLKFLPRATVASILFVAGYNLIEWFEIMFIIRMASVRDVAYLAIAFLASVFVNTEVGLMACILLSLMTLLKKSSKPEMAVLGAVQEGKDVVYRSIEEYPNAQTKDEIMIIRVLSSLRFYNSSLLRDRLARLEKQTRALAESYGKGPNPIQEFVLDIGLCREIDSTGALVLYELIHSLHHRHVRVCFANVKKQHRAAFKNAKITQEIGEDRLYETLDQAVIASRNRLTGPGYRKGGAGPEIVKIDMAYPPPAAY
ncbi:sulfate permease [Spizellomyces punctatus DAOM BR117]|uniref:Sulfate permease n=1 Tax=Spizellomyces punctatus (strain DAOM BR117) TaxID=645134 RepID=A0A0L0HGP1_SPIPD|nr:sulfate permease [Spizellomyces punctatus DAOM BR117]KND00631.1 sulfate permease [Spizellomyces punctatus DAOM BR117]|eukprot:XP_016608670.1 sulfate permease [Spizellomyces punctatus DAOM BR117]